MKDSTSPSKIKTPSIEGSYHSKIIADFKEKSYILRKHKKLKALQLNHIWQILLHPDETQEAS